MAGNERYVRWGECVLRRLVEALMATGQWKQGVDDDGWNTLTASNDHGVIRYRYGEGRFYIENKLALLSDVVCYAKKTEKA